jgi:hypothetical protein
MLKMPTRIILLQILWPDETQMGEILCQVISIIHGLFRKFEAGMLLAGGGRARIFYGGSHIVDLSLHSSTVFFH